MSEVHRNPQGGGYFLVSRKLLSVVRRQAATLHPLEQTDQGSLNSSRSLVLYLCCQQQAGLAVNHGNQAPCPRLAQDSVYLPVSDAKPLLNFLRSTLNGNSVLEMPPPILPRFTPVGLALAPQMLSRFKGQPPRLHGPVDGVYGYLEGFPTLDLFWRPAFFKPSLEKGLQFFVLQLEGWSATFAAQTVELVRLVGAVGSSDEVTPELPADSSMDFGSGYRRSCGLHIPVYEEPVYFLALLL